MSSNQELLNINSIYSTNGKLKKDWEFFLKDINNDSCIEKIVFLLQKNMSEIPQNELTVDIIDFIIDYGSLKMLNQIAQKQFMDSFLNLLKSETKAGVENQKKVIYLTKKWAQKFSGNQNFSIFQDNFNFLKNNGIAFPPDNFIIKTYDNYISKDDIQIALNNNQNNNNNNNFINFSNNQNNNNNDQKNMNPFENNNQSSNGGFPMQNNNSGFPMQNNDGGFPMQNNNSGFPMQNNNSGFPMQNNNDGFPKNDNNNFNFNNNNNYNNFNNYNHSNSGPSNFNYNNNPYNAYNSFNNDNNYGYNKNNSFSYNNNNNFSSPSDPNTLVDTWRQKIRTYNGYIGEGKFSYHAIKLKEGIKEILDSFHIIDNAMNQCFNDNTRRNLANVKSDMEQTCFRYECLKNDKKVEPFQSAFDGNSRKYFFDASNIFKEKEYIPYSNVEQENKVISGLERFGGAIKDGALFVGGKIKDAALGGYDFVKEKWEGRNNNNGN